MISKLPWFLGWNPSFILDADGEVVAENYKFVHVDDFEYICKAMIINWISVEDLLPDEDGPYLIYALSQDPKSSFITCAWYDPSIPAWSGLVKVWLEAITHWMPLPKEPKEK